MVRQNNKSRAMGNIKEDIRQKILEQLAWDSREEMEDLEIDVMDGRLILRGTVPSYETIRAIEDSAYAISGIQSVDNSLMIRYPDDITAVNDGDIKEWIVNGIKDNRSLNAAPIEVKVTDGMVNLKGTVDAYWKKRLVEDISLSATGSINVQNEIRVESMSKTVDEIIKQDIHKALNDNLNVRSEWITVEVNDGVVRLTGNVPDFDAARAAYVSAVFVDGVVDVRNDVVVKNL
jgi:osmotically-inducible protein OsmY